MRVLVWLCLLAVVCSVLQLDKGILRIFGLSSMDCASLLKFLRALTHNGQLFKGGFFVFGCFAPALTLLWVVLIFGLGLMFLDFTWHGKGFVQFLSASRGKSDDETRNGIWLKMGLDKACEYMVKSCLVGPLKFLEDSTCRDKVSSLVTKEIMNAESDAAGDDNERERCAEDEELDVMALRRLVKTERLRANLAVAELDKERMAAASAAEETMAMILRLQNEKSAMEIEANQFRKFAEQKLEYYEQVIESLQWSILVDESEKGELEENLSFRGQKLKPDISSDNQTQDDGSEASSSFPRSIIKDGSGDLPTSSSTLDFPLSIMNVSAPMEA